MGTEQSYPQSPESNFLAVKKELVFSVRRLVDSKSKDKAVAIPVFEQNDGPNRRTVLLTNNGEWFYRQDSICIRLVGELELPAMLELYARTVDKAYQDIEIKEELALEECDSRFQGKKRENIITQFKQLKAQFLYQHNKSLLTGLLDTMQSVTTKCQELFKSTNT